MKQTKVTDYRPDPENANVHSERGTKMLEDSLSMVGLGRSIVTDKNGIILAGNATQERAVDQGFTDAIEVETEGDQLVVVRRKDLDLLNDPDHRARLLSVLDNRVSEVSLSWQPEVLESYRLQGVPLDKAWTPVELRETLSYAAGDDFDPYEHWRGMPEFEQEEIECYHTIKVHFNTAADLQSFAQIVGQTVTNKTAYIYYPKQLKENLLAYRAIDES